MWAWVERVLYEKGMTDGVGGGNDGIRGTWGVV